MHVFLMLHSLAVKIVLRVIQQWHACTIEKHIVLCLQTDKESYSWPEFDRAFCGHNFPRGELTLAHIRWDALALPGCPYRHRYSVHSRRLCGSVIQPSPQLTSCRDLEGMMTAGGWRQAEGVGHSMTVCMDHGSICSWADGTTCFKSGGRLNQDRDPPGNHKSLTAREPVAKPAWFTQLSA